MVDIIRLNADPHSKTQQLLPWHVNGTLGRKERAEVETHLSQCAECREDFELEQTLARQVRTLPADTDGGRTALKARLAGVAQNKAAQKKAAAPSRRIPLRWAVAASLALLIPILTVALGRPHVAYRALGAAPSAEQGNVVVIFKPEATEAALRATLVRNQARIVDGPTAADAYVLHVAEDRRGAILARLKGDTDVSLAEPIDGDIR
jgi:anti-sigma factor RsiW